MTAADVRVLRVFRAVLRVVLCAIGMPVFVQAAQPSAFDYGFTHFTSFNSDLPYDTVYEIVQDGKGFVWFGTSSGLSRFDGVRFRNYTKEDLGLESAYVISLCLDDRDRLWVGTDLGVTIYDPETDRFEPFVRRSDRGTSIRNKVNALCKGPDGVIWISVNNQGLFAYDARNDALCNYFCENGRQTLPVNIRSLHADDSGGIWIALFYRSFHYIPPGCPIPASLDAGSEVTFFRNDDVTAVRSVPGDASTIYVASVARGLCRLDGTNGVPEVVIPASSRGFLPESLFIDRSQRVWMATNGGVYCYDSRSGETHLLTADAQDRFSLSDSHAFTVCVDAMDGLWVGTNVGGVNYAGAFQRNFEKYYRADGRSLEDCLVRGFADDGAGHIWIATEKEGLLLYDAVGRTLTRVDDDRLPSSQFTVCYDAGHLWLGTIKGLCRLDLGTKNVKIYDTIGLPDSMMDRRVFTVFRTSAGDLLVGTTVGLFRYDRHQDAFDSVEGFDGLFVTGIDEDAYGTLWVSTYARGLVRYDVAKREVERITNRSDDPTEGIAPSNKLFSVIAGSDGNIWTTSFGGGFSTFDPVNRCFRSYDRARYDCLPTDICFQILEDNRGTLWVSSDKGLLSLDPRTDEIRRFSIYDGLLNDDFKNCGLKTADGDLYFGSRSGFIRFNPSKVAPASGTPLLAITHFRIGDDPVVPAADGTSVLARNIDITERIQLSPRQNSFGFGFSLLNAGSPGLHTVVCRLEGYDEGWCRADGDRSVFYYNVPAGTYILKVKSLDSAGETSARHADLVVVVAQRFYKSTLAVVLYILFAAGMIVVIFKVCYHRAMVREQRKHEEYKQQKEAELFQQKLSFFSSIVHEIKTPLTVMHTPLRNIMALRQLDPALRDDLMVIGNSTEYLNRLVRELLDFVRIEKHGYRLDPRPFDLGECVGFLCSNFAETAKSRNLRFTVETEHVGIVADEAAVNKILNNLLHNAVKYAETDIRVSVRKQGEEAVVAVSNDGPPITPEHRTEIFKPFVQYGNDKDPSSGNFGIGLALARSLTEMHGGTLSLADDSACTTFLLALPAREEFHATEEPAPATDTKRPKLLLVEDNAELLAYLRRKLETEYRVLTARSAESARTLLGEHEIDILITDIALPGMNGIELCRTVASDFQHSHIPVIVVSAISATATKIACIEAGASTYIEKPFSLEYLQACIKGILDRRAGLKKAWQSPSGQIDPKQFNLLSADEEFLRRIDEVIMQHLGDSSFSSKQIEEALFLSRSTLIRKVRALLDTTPNDYLRFKRLSVAAQLLARNKSRVSEVCFAVGFNSPSYFAKCFKDQFGILPAEWQKRESSSKEP